VRVSAQPNTDISAWGLKLTLAEAVRLAYCRSAQKQGRRWIDTGLTGPCHKCSELLFEERQMQPEIQAIQCVGNFTTVAFKILIE
jgi:hypothetical protein